MADIEQVYPDVPQGPSPAFKANCFCRKEVLAPNTDGKVEPTEPDFVHRRDRCGKEVAQQDVDVEDIVTHTVATEGGSVTGVGCIPSPEALDWAKRSGESVPPKSHESWLGDQLVQRLSLFAGEAGKTESALECLARLIAELVSRRSVNPAGMAENVLNKTLELTHIELERCIAAKDKHCGVLTDNEVKPLIGLLETANRARMLRDALTASSRPPPG